MPTCDEAGSEEELGHKSFAVYFEATSSWSVETISLDVQLLMFDR